MQGLNNNKITVFSLWNLLQNKWKHKGRDKRQLSNLATKEEENKVRRKNCLFFVWVQSDFDSNQFKEIVRSDYHKKLLRSLFLAAVDRHPCNWMTCDYETFANARNENFQSSLERSSIVTIRTITNITIDKNIIIVNTC